MALITESDLNAYTGNYETNATKTIIIAAAESVVEDYLGYDTASTTRTYKFTGHGYDYATLPIPGASAVSSVTIDGTAIASALFALDTASNSVVLDDGYYFTRDATVVISYTAGFATVPDLIKLSCLRIAALMLDETNGNIGVTGKSFADMSKTFINYSNYDKYLRPISKYRIGGV